jgi:cellulose synthase/poly-beta-1,6-N-acetylglucosamine synthase-like glycosyltransferase
MFESVFYDLSIFLWAFILFNFGYTIVLAFAGLKRQKPVPKHEASKRFVCLIPAHNEANVIGDLIVSLKNEDYPSSLFDIYVVADHCEDDTAATARHCGAKVYVRNSGSKGKGGVIRFFLDKLFNEMTENYDAVCIFDADNIAHTDFLSKMNDALCEGRSCIQGYLGTKNPHDNWVTKSIYSSYLVTNRLWQLGKENLGLSAACGGTGFCVTTTVLRQFGWPAQSLTEDLEMQMLYSLNGVRFSWLHEAITFDEKPLSIKIAVKQRVRWTIGHLNVQRKYVPKFLIRVIRNRDIRLLDQVVYLLSPLYWVVFGILLSGFIAQFFVPLPMFRLGTAEAFTLDVLSLLIYPIAGIYLETKSLRALHMVPLLLVFTPIWFFAVILALRNFNRKEWFHTPHGSPKSPVL